jgi:hypothetical protein
MNPDQQFNVYGLTRRQQGEVKLGFAETFKAPQIGVYGNHIVQYFGSDAFTKDFDPLFFFNYFYANLSLPEIERYLLRIEKLGHLPKKLLIIQITPPHADNGDFIVNWGTELPPDIILSGEKFGTGSDLTHAAQIYSLVAENWMGEILNYNTFLLGLISDSKAGRVFTPGECAARQRNWLEKLPFMLQGVLRSWSKGGFYCNPRTWGGAFRRDGSVPFPLQADGVTPLQVQDAPMSGDVGLQNSTRGLSSDDDERIVQHMLAINEIGERNGIKTVFLIPPVYEMPGRNSVVNKIFDRALLRVPHLEVIDHRGLAPDPSFFLDQIHPSPKYYKFLVKELRKRRLMESAAEQSLFEKNSPAISE